MHTLWLRFGIVLEDYSLEEHSLGEGRHSGPLFHRFLPEGEKDAIHLQSGDADANLKIWFERRGFVNDRGFIQFDDRRQEVDETLIAKQAVLDAGPLRGMLEIRNLSEEQVAPLKDNKIDDPTYVALGKRVVNLIYPPVSRFIAILRTNYGQYWLDELNKWDSRSQSLGSYLNGKVQTKWSLDMGGTWERFIPTRLEQRLTVPLPLRRDFKDYLTREDWTELSKIMETDYIPSVAAIILRRAHRLLDQGEIKQALIETVTALEIAISDFMRQKVKSSQLLSAKVQSFWNLPLPTQIISIAATLGTTPLQDIETVIRVIDMRNEVVHEGTDPSHDCAAILKVLETIALLLAGPEFKFPSYQHSNWRREVEEWDRDNSLPDRGPMTVLIGE
jgi:hypothetical protein